MSPSLSVSVAFQTVFVLSYITLGRKGGWEVILDLNRHEEILGTGTHEVDARGGDGTNAPVFGEAWDYLGAISVPRASSGCPRRYTGMPLVS